MVLTCSLGELKENQILQYCYIELNINDRTFIYIYIYIYILQGALSDPGFHAISNRRTE